ALRRGPLPVPPRDGAGQALPRPPREEARHGPRPGGPRRPPGPRRLPPAPQAGGLRRQTLLRLVNARSGPSASKTRRTTPTAGATGPCRGAGGRTGASSGRASPATAIAWDPSPPPSLTPRPRTPDAWISPRHESRYRAIPGGRF